MLTRETLTSERSVRMRQSPSVLVFVLVVLAAAAENSSRPTVHIVAMESTGKLDAGATYFVRYLKPLFTLALEDANNTFGEHIDIHFEHKETLCGQSMVGVQAAQTFYQEKVDVFLGPVCNDGVVTLGYMALAWDIPLISPRGNTRLIRNTSIFPNVVSLHPYDKYELVKFTAFLLETYNWQHVSIFSDQDSPAYKSTGDTYFTSSLAQGISWNYIAVSTTTFTNQDYDTRLLEAGKQSVAFVLVMDLEDVRQLMLRASALNMTQGLHVFIVPEFQGLSDISSSLWRRNDSTDVKARQAFRSVLFISVLTSPVSDYYVLTQRLNENMFGSNTSLYVKPSVMEKEDEMSAGSTNMQQTILAGYYNSIMMYLTVANETFSDGGNVTDGKKMARKMSNRTFSGIAGTFHMATDGHRDTDMALVDMTDPWNGTFQRVGIYRAEIGQLILLEGVTKHWPGLGNPPQDNAECRLYDQLCDTYSRETVVQGHVMTAEESANLAIGLSTSISIFVIASAVACFVALRNKIARRRTKLTWWKIDVDELQPIKKNMTKSTFSSILRQSNTNATDTSLTNCSVCMYKGFLVRQHPMCTTDFPVNARLLKEFEEIRDMNHPNLLRVVGACLDGDKRALITEHCPKGSLQEVIMDETFKLDNVFCLSILTDIVRALIYIHKRSMRFHGRLTSEICMIDSRFSVKVGYYGLSVVYDTVQLQSKEQSREKDCLWKAPELLKSQGKGSQEGDIYSLAIIMSEVVSREEPYSNDKEYLTTSEVLNKIRTCQEPPFRPAVTTPPDLVQLETVMKQSWDEEPQRRPSLNKIAAVLHSLMSKFNKAGSLVDNLLQRLEKYSNNLEKIVDEKVNELRQEKHKSEELLRQMLPKSVADRLKAGLTVEPEQYECVTIYFSDIVGFTEMCSELKPVQIINLLNDLYSCFDGTLENYDVYKVETIGDGYMVVSGLPTRNGNEHACQIARMSLALLDVIATFTPIETSEDRLMLRIGLHSGPVCAGVVGLKMPRYCLFGDTVNTASRMESNGVECKVHMSSSTAEILKSMGNFTMKRRGQIEIKGKGLMETYWLTGETMVGPENSTTRNQQSDKASTSSDLKSDSSTHVQTVEQSAGM